MKYYKLRVIMESGKEHLSDTILKNELLENYEAAINNLSDIKNFKIHEDGGILSLHPKKIESVKIIEVK
jgi:hypothetical protein